MKLNINSFWSHIWNYFGWLADRELKIRSIQSRQSWSWAWHLLDKCQTFLWRYICGNIKGLTHQRWFKPFKVSVHLSTAGIFFSNNFFSCSLWYLWNVVNIKPKWKLIQIVLSLGKLKPSVGFFRKFVYIYRLIERKFCQCVKCERNEWRWHPYTLKRKFSHKFLSSLLYLQLGDGWYIGRR